MYAVPRRAEQICDPRARPVRQKPKQAPSRRPRPAPASPSRADRAPNRRRRPALRFVARLRQPTSDRPPKERTPAAKRMAARRPTMRAGCRATAAGCRQLPVGVPKTRTGPVEAIRVVRAARRGAVGARTQIDPLHSMLFSAPPQRWQAPAGLEGRSAPARRRRCPVLPRSSPGRCRPLLSRLPASGWSVRSSGVRAAGDNPDRLRSEAPGPSRRRRVDSGQLRTH